MCRYSDGTEYVNGPPPHECAPGADPVLPFCGGACGDTCPAVGGSPVFSVGCFGMSETRGFGVCSPTPNPPCTADNVAESFRECGVELGILSGGARLRCACLRLAREPGGPIPERGEPVALDSCLAYRSRYPDQVSCVGDDWVEL